MKMWQKFLPCNSTSIEKWWTSLSTRNRARSRFGLLLHPCGRLRCTRRAWRAWMARRSGRMTGTAWTRSRLGMAAWTGRTLWWCITGSALRERDFQLKRFDGCTKSTVGLAYLLGDFERLRGFNDFFFVVDSLSLFAAVDNDDAGAGALFALFLLSSCRLIATVWATISSSRARCDCGGGDDFRVELVFDVDAAAVSLIFLSSDSFAFAAISDFKALRRLSSRSSCFSIVKYSSTSRSFNLTTSLVSSADELSWSFVAWSRTTGAGLRCRVLSLLEEAFLLSRMLLYFSGLRRAGE